MKCPGRRKRKVKVRKKSSGQPSPAEEPEGPGGGGGDSRAAAARGLLPPNRVGQEEPVPAVTATLHPGKRQLWRSAGTTHPRTLQDPSEHSAGWFWEPATQWYARLLVMPSLLALLADGLSQIMEV